MLTKDDIESFLVRLGATGATFSEVEPGFWILRPSEESDLSIAVNYTPPVVLLRIDVMTLPTNGQQSATLVSSSRKRSSSRRSTMKNSSRATRA